MQTALVGATYTALLKRFGPPRQDKRGHYWTIGTLHGGVTLSHPPGEPLADALTWRAQADTDAAIDDLCDLIRRPADQLTVHVQPARYEVCALPPDFKAWRLFVLNVEYRGDGRWAVCHHGMAYSGDDKAQLTGAGPTPTFTLDEALELAKRLAPTIRVNRFTVADALANGPDWY